MANKRSVLWRRQREKLWVLVALLLFATYPTFQAAFMESRTYRDVMRLTPFHHVTVNTVSPLGEDAVLVSGTMIKRRCTFVEALAYTSEGDHSALARLEFNPYGEEPPVHTRPAMPLPQSWGPWKITSRIPNPETFHIYVRHACPGEPIDQMDLFAAGPWARVPG